MSLNRFSETELILGLKEGNKTIYAILFKLYYSPLCTYAATIIKFDYLAEEVVQETFVKLWETRQQLQITVSLRAFLYRCVHNHCLNYIKNLQVTQRRNDSLIKEITYHATIATQNFTEDILENLVSEELEIFFGKEINNLPEQCREIFSLSRYEQLTYAEIAEKLNISVNTVKTQITRALDKLRDAFKNM